MKLYASALLALVSLSAEPISADVPPVCNGSDRLTTNTASSLMKGEAICDQPWQLGINNNGQFGLWKDGVIFEEYATGAETLEVTEAIDSSGGGSALLSAYDSDSTLIWEVGCVDVPTNITAKLVVQNATHVVKFTKQQRLWSVKDDGENILDIRCIVITPGNDTEPTEPSSDEAPSASPTDTASPTSTSEAPSASPTDTTSESPSASPTNTSSPTVWTPPSGDGYNCDDKNPCTAGSDQYYPADDPAFFVQCGSGATCYVRDCGPGTIWEQSLLTCISAGQNVYISLLCQAWNISSLCSN